jgi:hypothetical protein
VDDFGWGVTLDGVSIACAIQHIETTKARLVPSKQCGGALPSDKRTERMGELGYECDADAWTRAEVTTFTAI